MGINFLITYEENPNGMYIAGQPVRGRAVITNDQSIPFKRIQLKIRGYAKVRWSEGSGESRRNYYDREKYFESITECVDTKGKEQSLEPGTYTYNFECLLPSECPSSFQSMYGCIRYDTKITIVRPMKLNKSYSMGFNVLSLFDLNHLPALRVPMQVEVTKHFYYGPFKSKPLVMSLDIPQTSFVPGEYISFNSKLVNNSSTTINGVVIALNLVAVHSVRHSVRTRMQKILLTSRKYGAFSKNVLEFRDRLLVPPTPPTCENLCQIIKITYEVELTAQVKGMHLNKNISIPVVIGNIPYVEKSANTSVDALIANLTNSVAPGLCNDWNTEIPPPSYQEAVFVQPWESSETGSKKEDKSFGKFTPRYPFYGTVDSSSSEVSKGDLKIEKD